MHDQEKLRKIALQGVERVAKTGPLMVARRKLVQAYQDYFAGVADDGNKMYGLETQLYLLLKAEVAKPPMDRIDMHEVE